MAVALATSPARWPPIPSATAHSPRASSTRTLSSFSGRPRPTSVRAPDDSLMGTPPAPGSLDDLQDRLADLELVAPVQRHGLAQAVAVEEGAVGRAEVLHEGAPIADVDPGVELGDVGVVGQGYGAARGAADRHLLTEREDLGGGRVDHLELVGLGRLVTAPAP